MTDFHNILRSQQFAEQARQFQDARRDQANAGMAQGIAGLGQSIVQISRYERELAMQQADAAMRHALISQEMQANQIKLQQMAQIDAIDMSAQQKRAATLQNDLLEQELLERKRRYESDPENLQARLFYETAGRLRRASDLLAIGYRPDLESRKWVKLTEEDRQELARLAELEGRDGISNPEREEDLSKSRAVSRASTLLRMADDSFDDPQTASMYRSLAQQDIERLREKHGIPKTSQPAPERVDLVAKPTGSDARVADSIYTQLESGLSGNPGFKYIKSDVRRIADFLWQYREQLYDFAVRSAAPGRKPVSSPEEAIDLVIEAVQRGDASAIQMLLQNGVIGETARAVLIRK